jgi:hypothetical protein
MSFEQGSAAVVDDDDDDIYYYLSFQFPCPHSTLNLSNSYTAT